MAGLPATYEFGDVRVEAVSERVVRSGSPVELEPKAFALLVYFIQHRGQLLDKEKILDAMWGETFVSENALTRVVGQLRKALGDDAHESKYIETVPRRGYRFVADVRTVVVEAHPRRGKKRLLITSAVLAVLAAVVVALLDEAKVEELAPLDMPVQVTSTAVLDIFPSMSPDGNAVAFSSNRGGPFEIYVKQLTPSGELVQLTSDGSQNFQPAWSPIGDLIAYHSKNGGGIWTVAAFGGAPRKLTEFGSRPAWSPDGRWIAFQSSPLKDLGSNAGALAPSTIWVCARDGGPPRQLTHVEAPPGGHESATWSPHGDRIAFTATFAGPSTLWTVSLEGELELMPKPHARIYDVVYAPSGDELYLTGDGGDFFGLWRLDLLRQGSKPWLVKRIVWPVMRYPTFSADGKKLAYTGVITYSNLASVSLSPDTYEPVGPPRLLTHYTNERNFFPRFSPDGRTVAFERYFENTSDVWLIDADGANPRRLTTHPSEEGYPHWSGDGQRVIFFSYRQGHAPGAWTVDVDSREETFLQSIPSHWGSLGLSRDATKIAFTRARGYAPGNIWVASVGKGGEERQVTFDEWVGTLPFWSPDGELIAFGINRGEDDHIAVVPADGGTPEQLTREPGQNWAGAWSPDSDKIAFTSWRDDVWNLWWISRDDKSERRLTDYATLNTFVRYPDWSPLGDQIVYEYGETTGDIWMLEVPEAYQR